MTERHGTCNVACWQAKEATCRCLCSGKNHGITRRGGAQPQRLTQRKTRVYELVAITNNWPAANAGALEAWRERGLRKDWGTPPILVERANERTLKWPEVQAVHAQRPWHHSPTWLAWVKVGPEA